jgi:hypothetical protein
VRTPLLLYALALATRLAVLWQFPVPAYADSSYYVEVARALADGRGFTVDFIWIFAEVGGTIPADPVLPIPSNAHWMPLASLVQVPFIALLGPTAVASAVPFALIGSLAAPLAWAIARDAGARSFVALAAGILTAIPVLTFAFMVQPDNFALFQPLAAGALWLTARALRGTGSSGREFALAGLLVGLATLSRNDGVLVGAVVAIAFGGDRWRAWRSAGTRRPTIPFWAAVSCFGLFLLMVGPWWLRQLDVFGQLSPSTASGKVLFIRDIGEWNSITTPATLDHLLGQGVGPLIASRVGGLVAATWIFVVLVCGVVLAPFVVVGAWGRRRSPVFGPFFVYAGLLFAFSAVVSAVHVTGGTFIHSAVALVPHGCVLLVEGVAASAAWTAARLGSGRQTEVSRVAAGAAVALGIAIAVVGVTVVHDGWRGWANARAAVADALDGPDPDRSDRIMSIDAAGYRYYTGRGGVVLVNDPLATIRDVAAAYGIRWLIIDGDEPVGAVTPIVRGERPEWVGAPILERVPASGPAVRVYPVCLSVGDVRCEDAS